VPRHGDPLGGPPLWLTASGVREGSDYGPGLGLGTAHDLKHDKGHAKRMDGSRAYGSRRGVPRRHFERLDVFSPRASGPSAMQFLPGFKSVYGQRHEAGRPGGVPATGRFSMDWGETAHKSPRAGRAGFSSAGEVQS